MAKYWILEVCHNITNNIYIQCHVDTIIIPSLHTDPRRGKRRQLTSTVKASQS